MGFASTLHILFHYSCIRKGASEGNSEIRRRIKFAFEIRVREKKKNPMIERIRQASKRRVSAQAKTYTHTHTYQKH